MLQVKVPFRKLKHIHHISDIQIRNLKRHKEYEEVFNRLYEKVKEISLQLRCMTCQNQSIHDSDADFSLQIKKP